MPFFEIRRLGASCWTLRQVLICVILEGVRKGRHGSFRLMYEHSKLNVGRTRKRRPKIVDGLMAIGSSPTRYRFTQGQAYCDISACHSKLLHYSGREQSHQALPETQTVWNMHHLTAGFGCDSVGRWYFRWQHPPRGREGELS